MATPTIQLEKAQRWQHRLVIAATGFLIFETLSGLSILLLPFSISNQVIVLVHTLVGLVFIIPAAWYQVSHYLIYRSIKMDQIKLTGYFSTVATVVAAVTGLVLTYQVIFQTRISPLMDLIHIISTFALVATLLPHILIIMIRDFRAGKTEVMQPILAAQRRFGSKQIYLLAAFASLVALLVFAYQPVELDNNLPDDYSFLYGPDRPFAPSLARTRTGGAIDARALSGSQACGSSRCHVEIVKEWEVSAHRYAAMDPAFQAVQKVMGEQNGPESTRYCAGCHDPISLFSGSINIYTEELTHAAGYQEGVSCIACHSIKESDVKGNASYVIDQPRRYMFELHAGKTARMLRDFLIRAYPKQHVESLQHRMFKSPEFCASCHKQFIDQEINQVGWVQLQNQYDNWRKSRWNHPDEPTKTIECRECHMPLVASTDPSSGDYLDYNRTSDDGKHRSHRFLGANQFIPKLLNLPGAEEHTALTEQWLQGKYDIPEIADKWRKGPAIRMELIVPEVVTAGQEVKIQTVVSNNKVGHNFPTGPLDIIQAWVELIVTDQDGNEVYSSGRVDERNFLQPGTFIFKAEAVDQYGNLIDRHNLWEMVGVRYRRVLFPGSSDRAEFSFACPSVFSEDHAQIPVEENFRFMAPGKPTSRLHVAATLRYRKIDQFLLNYLFGEESGITAPISMVSEDFNTIEVISQGL
ncbi:MAG: hypothetical protein IID15_03080 [Candidatus Marinimicrobia bacterium]|nr:hypothetical protein [Candidatus Neomarinimicrobiota bacterium]